ncbi:MAG: hypothetical protein FWD40_02820 [Treponema sp.]|nr:hypothetical protein [Treponema sp.]
MEELQSTEILDREILEDARKKAMRIFKQTEDTMQSDNAQWEKKINESIDKLDIKYNEQKYSETDRRMKRLPVDKHRIKIEKIQNMLDFAAESWYKSLSRDQILKLLSCELEKRFACCNDLFSDRQIHAYYNALDYNEAEELVKKISPACLIKKNKNDSAYPSIILETDEVIITSSIEIIIESILSEKRAELTASLLGQAYTEGA